MKKILDVIYFWSGVLVVGSVATVFGLVVTVCALDLAAKYLWQL
jgi:hypothetical protein